MAGRILLIDANRDTRELLSTGLTEFLELDGYRALSADSVHSGIKTARGKKISLVVLALTTGDPDNLVNFELLKSHPDLAHVPVLVLANDDDEAQEVTFLDHGADDYIAETTGFKADRFFAHCRRLLRRGSGPQKKSTKVLKLGRLTLDLKSKSYAFRGKIYKGLALQEFKLLLFLAKHPGEPMGRKRLFREVWPHRAIELPPDSEYSEKTLFPNRAKRFAAEKSLRTVEEHITRLRKKLGQRLIKNIRGKGYLLAPPRS